MFGAIKRIFHRNPPAEASVALPTTAASTRAPSQTSSVAHPVLKASPTQSDENSILISLAAIQPAIPAELFHKAKLQGLDRHRIAISKKEAAQQIRSGSVKVTLQHLKQSTPPGLFVDDPQHDSILIPLPLKDIVEHLPQTAFTKRADQKQVEVPDNIQDLFGSNGEAGGLRVLGKNEVAPATPPSTTAPAIPEAPLPIPTPEPQPPAQTKPIPMPGLPQPTGSLTTNVIPDDPNVERLRVPLEELLSSWPAQIQAEAAALRLMEATCALPLPPVKEGLRNGSVRFHWKSIRSWLEPTPPADPSPHDETVLELSLRVLSNRIISNLSQHTAMLRKTQTGTPTAPLQPADSAPAATPVVPPLKAKPAAAATPKSAPLPKQTAPKVNLAPPEPFPEFKPDLSPAPNLSELQPAPAARITKTPAPSKPAASPSPGSVLSVDLATVTAAWTEEVQHGIESAGTEGRTLEIPLDAIEAALKQGKVSYTWSQIEAWINPPLGDNTIDGSQQLTLPLQVIAPLYMAHRPNQQKNKLPDDLDIPDIFGQSESIEAIPDPEAEAEPQSAPEPQPKAEPQPAPEAAGPAEPAAPKAAQQTPAPRLTTKSLPELFGEPDKKSWTPNEIVHHTTLLPEVDGALIALQDGLLVASAMPPHWKTETVAAFIPQIFGRMKQYSAEIAMGELTSISFTVEQGTFQVFNAGIIYFAALGQPTARLPIPELNLIALELSRHTK